jgi:hypothetical protein
MAGASSAQATRHETSAFTGPSNQPGRSALRPVDPRTTAPPGCARTRA